MAGRDLPRHKRKLGGAPVAQSKTQAGRHLVSTHTSGQVESVTGEVLATLTDGTLDTLAEGGPVPQGDSVQTGPGAAVGILVIDDTT